MRKKTATQETGLLRRFRGLDPLDLELIGELELDATQSYSQLAKKLGISRPTVSHKVHRLMDTGALRVMCLADHLALGFTTGVALGISVLPSEALNTANKLAYKKPIQQVFLCAGRFDIMAWALFREPEHLLHFLSADIGELPGVLRVESMVTLSMVKFSPAMVADRRGWHPRRPRAPKLDDMDLALIRELQTDARQRSSAMAKRLAVDTSTVSRRVQKLLNDGIIRIVTEADPFALGYKAVASIGMRFDPTKLDDAAEAVASYRAVHTLSVVTGRYDLIAWAVFGDMGDLHRFLTKELGKIPGLKEIETMMNLKVVKRSYAFLTDNNK